MKKSLWIAALGLSFILLPGADLQAQVGFGGQVLYNSSLRDGSVGVGGSAYVPLAAFDIRGGFNWYFPDCPSGLDCDFWELALDATVGFLEASPVSPYLGAGLGYQKWSVGLSEEGETPFRVIGGLELGTLLPAAIYVEGAYLLPNDLGDQLIFSVGVRF